MKEQQQFIRELCEDAELAPPNLPSIEEDLESQIEICYCPTSFALKGCYGRYLYIDPDTNEVSTGSTWNGAWHSFNREETGANPSEVYLHCSNGKYLMATSEGQLKGSNNKLDWEKFVLVPVPGKSNVYWIRSYHGHFIAFNKWGHVFTFRMPES